MTNIVVMVLGAALSFTNPKSSDVLVSMTDEEVAYAKLPMIKNPAEFDYRIKENGWDIKETYTMRFDFDGDGNDEWFVYNGECGSGGSNWYV